MVKIGGGDNAPHVTPSVCLTGVRVSLSYPLDGLNGGKQCKNDPRRITANYFRTEPEAYPDRFR